LQLALSTIVTHAASFLVETYFGTMGLLGDDQFTTNPSITNLTIKFCHNKAHSYTHTHTHTRERERERDAARIESLI